MKRVLFLLTPTGVFVIVVALGIAHAHVADPSYEFGGSRLQWAIGYATTLSIAAYSVGLPDVPRLPRQVFAAALGASITGAIGISLLQLGVGVAVLPRFVVFGGLILTVPWFVAASQVITWGRRRVDKRDRILVVAGTEAAAQLIAELDGSPERPVLAGTAEPGEMRPRPDSASPLISLANNTSATIVVLDRVAQMDQTIVDQAALLHESGVRIRTLSLFYEQWLNRLPVSELERVSLMFDIGEVHRERYSRRKRLLDIVVVAVSLPVLLTITPLVLFGNLLANRGPLFFSQDRVGKAGERFRIFKFRTMIEQQESAGTWTTDGDPRVTPWGRFLRQTHIDELPQLWNIAKGELSLMGPRPEQPHYVAQLSRKLPFYNLRHLVQPGLTGWAQVNQGYASSDVDALEKLQYEFWYLRHQSLAMDLRIIARTGRVVLQGQGR